MLIRPWDAVRYALEQIQEKGYVLSPEGSREVGLIWVGEGEAPNVSPFIDIIQAGSFVLHEVLAERTVNVPLWVLLGYPWSRPLVYWEALLRSNPDDTTPIESRRWEYAAACVSYHHDPKDTRWNNIVWKEPWPLLQPDREEQENQAP